MKKVYQNELGPQPVPLRVFGEVVEEDEVRNRFFYGIDNGSASLDPRCQELLRRENKLV